VVLLDTKESLEAIIKFSKDKSFQSNIDNGLKKTLDDMLPDDIVERSNGRLHVVTTKVWPSFERKPIIINHFKDREHLLDTISASCFIPLYSTPNKLFTRIQQNPGELFIDGGVFAWMPPLGDIRVSPFPRDLLSLVGKRTPHICLPNHAIPARKLLSWILSPAPPNQLRYLYEMGKSEAEIFITETTKKNNFR
jgi:hypothetical protein